MEQGIGRAGFRLLALAFWGVGMAGLSLAVYAVRVAQTTFAWAGLATTGVAISLLLIFAFSVPAVKPVAKATPRREVLEPVATKPAPEATPEPPKPVAKPEPVAPPVPEPVDEEEPNASYFEYDDYEPAATAAPESVVIPEAFEEPAPPPGQWPSRPKRGQATTVQQTAGADPRFAKRYTQNTPMVRDILGAGDEAQHVTATLAPDDWGPGAVGPEQMVGQCGQCAAKLIAPKSRPVHLTCPACGAAKLLQ